LETSGLKDRYTSRFTKSLGECRAGVRQLFRPRKGIPFRARKSLITDIRAGSQEKHITFCISVATSNTWF
jgi:hypothetical protein